MSNALLCNERLDNCRAEYDPVIFSDSRVFDNLLKDEKKSLIVVDYFTEVQNGNIHSGMRDIVTSWMSEVCEDAKCESQVLPLAVRLMDLFLSCCVTARHNLQLLAAVCIHIASKVRQVTALSTDLLVYYTDNSITAMDMLRVELMLLMKLNWQVSTVTSYDFLEHILNRVPWSTENELLRRHAHILLHLCCTDTAMIQLRPSVVAGGVIMAAARGLRIPSFPKVMSHLTKLIQCNENDILIVEERVEYLVRREEAKAMPQSRAPTAAPIKTPSLMNSGNGNVPLDILISEDDDLMDTSQPETPTDIQDIHF